MKFEKVALKKRWTTPEVRQIPVTDEIIRRFEERHGRLDPEILRKIAKAR